MIHPSVVLAGPDARNRYDIATISTEHPDNPPRAPLKVFHPTTTIRGDVSFYQRNAAYGDLRPWIDGNITQPMAQSQVVMLRTQIIIIQPQLPSNDGYFPAASSSIGDHPWSKGSGYGPQIVYGQHVFRFIPPHAAHRNVHPPSFPSPSGQLYPLQFLKKWPTDMSFPIRESILIAADLQHRRL